MNIKVHFRFHFYTWRLINFCVCVCFQSSANDPGSRFALSACSFQSPCYLQMQLVTLPRLAAAIVAFTKLDCICSVLPEQKNKPSQDPTPNLALLLRFLLFFTHNFKFPHQPLGSSRAGGRKGWVSWHQRIAESQLAQKKRKLCLCTPKINNKLNLP